MPNTTDIAREEFHQIYGEQIEWLEGYVASGTWPDDARLALTLWRRYEAQGYLANTDLLSLVELYDRLSVNDAPAGRDDAVWIPNGYYLVGKRFPGQAWDMHEMLVYTVRRGQLAGQRVIKIRRQGSDRFRSGYEAFAFLTRRGGMRLWQRFAADAQAPYVQAFLAVLNHFGPSNLEELVFPEEPIYFCNEENTVEYSVEMDRRCAECNTELVEEQIPIGFCTEHQSVPYMTFGPGNNPHNVFAHATRLRSRQEHSVQVEEAVMPVRHRPLPRCQLGTGEVQ